MVASIGSGGSAALDTLTLSLYYELLVKVICCHMVALATLNIRFCWFWLPWEYAIYGVSLNMMELQGHSHQYLSGQVEITGFN